MQEVRAGSSGCEVIIEKEIVVKKGEYRKLLDERQAYQRLRDCLGESAGILPRIYGFEDIGSGQAELRMERLHGQDFEDFIMKTSYEKERLFVIDSFVAKVLEILDSWQDISFLNVKKSLLLRELIDALSYSVSKVDEFGGWSTLRSLLNDPKIIQHILKDIHFNPCHRDLNANNIWVSSDGKVRVFDPLWTLPGSRVTSIGHAVLDLAAFRVSIERLQSDRDEKYLCQKLPLQMIDEIADFWIVQGRFCRELYELALLERYLYLCGCRCNFCMHRSRVHRVRLMQRRACEIRDSLISKLRRWLS